MKKGVIAAGDPITAKAGQEILMNGGNAYDAAVAAAFTSFASESTLTSAGGGGFCMTYPVDGKPVLYDFFCQTPGIRHVQKVQDFYDVVVNFTDSTQIFHIGLATCSVPGNVAGLLHIHEKLGKLPLNEILRPAIEASREGITVTPYIYLNFHIVSDILLAEKPSRDIYKPGGKLLKVGEKYHLPDYADFLEALASEGKRIFYEGEYARAIVKDSDERGGHLTMKDFRNYEVIERRPLSLSYRDYEVLTNPPPSSGGILIAYMLRLLESVDFSNVSFGSKEHLNYLVNCFRYTADSRREYFNNRNHEINIVQEFLDMGRIKELGQALRAANSRFPNTTHISIEDIEGNIAAITTSFGTGSGYIIPGTDCMMNNMLGEEDLNPDGFHLWPFNHRMTSMMSPSIVVKDKEPVMVLGSGGANRIRTAILQSIVNYLDLGLLPDDSVNLPRIHWENNVLSYEPGYDFNEIKQIDDFETFKIDSYSEPNMFFGGVQAIMLDEKGKRIGAGDRRREGVVLYV